MKEREKYKKERERVGWASSRRRVPGQGETTQPRNDTNNKPVTGPVARRKLFLPQAPPRPPSAPQLDESIRVCPSISPSLWTHSQEKEGSFIARMKAKSTRVA